MAQSIRTSTSRQRQPRVKPHRTCRLEQTAEPTVYLLTLTVGRKVTSYRLTSIGSDDAECGVRLEKLASSGDVLEVYDVELFSSRGYHTCSCLGFTAHNHCKHAESLLALHERGQLGPIVCKPVCRRPACPCTVCGVNSVDVENGEDTCWSCEHAA